MSSDERPSLGAQARRRKALALLLAIASPAALCVAVLWVLHHPNPRVIAPVAIDRNSLLPHHYAGPCMNCHRINEIGPVSINANNMNAFALSPMERQLLRAGQRVDVPGLSQKLRIPAITRTQNLPHSYVGVCCNCHVVLDVHPTPEFMNEALRMARVPLSIKASDAVLTARGGAVWDATRERNRRGWGYVALFTLVTAVAAAAVRRAQFARAGHAPSDSKEHGNAMCLTIHGWAAATFCVAAMFHWYYSDRGNNLLHLALVLLSAISAVGVLLRHRLFTDTASGSRILWHVKRSAVVLFIGLLVFGHLFSGF